MALVIEQTLIDAATSGDYEAIDAVRQKLLEGYQAFRSLDPKLLTPDFVKQLDRFTENWNLFKKVRELAEKYKVPQSDDSVEVDKFVAGISGYEKIIDDFIPRSMSSIPVIIELLENELKADRIHFKQAKSNLDVAKKNIQIQMLDEANSHKKNELAIELKTLEGEQRYFPMIYKRKREFLEEFIGELTTYQNLSTRRAILDWVRADHETSRDSDAEIEARLEILSPDSHLIGDNINRALADIQYYETLATRVARVDAPVINIPTAVSDDSANKMLATTPFSVESERAEHPFAIHVTPADKVGVIEQEDYRSNGSRGTITADASISPSSSVREAASAFRVERRLSLEEGLDIVATQQSASLRAQVINAELTTIHPDTAAVVRLDSMPILVSDAVPVADNSEVIEPMAKPTVKSKTVVSHPLDIINNAITAEKMRLEGLKQSYGTAIFGGKNEIDKKLRAIANLLFILNNKPSEELKAQHLTAILQTVRDLNEGKNPRFYGNISNELSELWAHRNWYRSIDGKTTCSYNLTIACSKAEALLLKQQKNSVKAQAAVQDLTVPSNISSAFRSATPFNRYRFYRVQSNTTAAKATAPGKKSSSTEQNAASSVVDHDLTSKPTD